jgi:enoyl-CoA hydratase/carnithine racemase
VLALLTRATRGSRESKGIGKTTLYAQLDLGQTDAYRLAIEVMAATSQTDSAREGIAAFLEKRPPSWPE